MFCKVYTVVNMDEQDKVTHIPNEVLYELVAGAMLGVFWRRQVFREWQIAAAGWSQKKKLAAFFSPSNRSYSLDSPKLLARSTKMGVGTKDGWDAALEICTSCFFPWEDGGLLHHNTAGVSI